MLAELGLKDTNGDGYLEDGEGHTIEITIITNADNSQRTKTAAFIGSNLQAVGIKAVATPVSLNTVVDVTQSSFNFDAVVLGWGSPVPPGPTNRNILVSRAEQQCFRTKDLNEGGRVSTNGQTIEAARTGG